MESLLDFDRSELESHLFTQLSELGKREQEDSDETEEDVDIEEFQNNATKKENDPLKRGTNKRSATKTGPILEGEFASRGRPRKPHEPVPFLSIDNLPSSKCNQLSPLDLNAIRQVSFISNPNVPYNTPSRTSFRHVASRTSTAPTVSGASTEWNSLVPKRQRGKVKEDANIPHINLLVQTPFKQNVNNTPRIKRVPSPSCILREKTSVATYQVSRAIAKQKRPAKQSLSAGRLLKAKLKPMKPVDVNGPSIDKCRGIQPEPRRVDMSGSNTVQRRRQIMNTLTRDPNALADDPALTLLDPERPHTSESVHQTSIVSDLSDTRFLDIKEDLEAGEKLGQAPATEQSQQQSANIETPQATRGQTESSDVSRGHSLETPPRTPYHSETGTSVKREISDIDSLTNATERSLMESGPRSVTEMPEDLRQDELPCTSDPPRMSRISSDLTAAQNQNGDSRDVTPAARIDEKRPRTAGDGLSRKVRFADERSDTQRSQSATARLRTSSRKGNTRSKVEEPLPEQPSPDKQNKEATEDKANDKTVDTKLEVSDNGEKQTTFGENVNNNNFLKQKTLKMKVGCIRFTKPRRIKSVPVSKSRPKSASCQVRPRSKLGPWEDRMKPDMQNIRDLNICGRSTEANSGILGQGTDALDNDLALIAYYGEPSAKREEQGGSQQDTENRFDLPGRTCGRAARPLSAKLGTRDFGLESKRSLIRRARPLSAYLCSQLESDSLTLESRGAQLAERDVAVAVTNSSRAVVEPNITYQSAHRRRRLRRRREVAGLNLAQLITHAKARVCSQCGEGALCYVSVDELIVCDNCALDGASSDEGVEPELGSMSARADDGCYDSDELEMEGDESDSDEEALHPQQAERFASLEQSLAQVQHHITHSRARNHARSPFATPRFLGDVLDLDMAEEQQHLPRCLHGFVRDFQASKAFESRRRMDTVPSGWLSDQLTGNQLTENKEQKATHEDEEWKEQEVHEKEDKDAWALAIIEVENTARTEQSLAMEPRNKDSLQVKATSTPLRPRSGAAAEPVCPYPPLCFRLNARPPQGYCYYFAYGTDMNPNRLSSYIKRDSVERFWALLFGFQMKFNRKGEDEEAGCFPNLEYCAEASVEGVLYAVTPEELARVDACVGFPQYVEQVVLPVWFSNTSDPDALGVAQYCVAAVTYITKDQWTVTDCSEVANEYAVSQCIKSADLLSPAYREYLIAQIN